MNKNHYVSLQVAKDLEEAGINLETEGVWWEAGYKYSDGHEEHWKWELTYKSQAIHCKGTGELQSWRTVLYFKTLPAPSLGELLDYLPDEYYVGKTIKIKDSSIEWDCRKVSCGLVHPGIIYADTAPNAAAAMAIKLEKT